MLKLTFILLFMLPVFFSKIFAQLPFDHKRDSIKPIPQLDVLSDSQHVKSGKSSLTQLLHSREKGYAKQIKNNIKRYDSTSLFQFFNVVKPSIHSFKSMLSLDDGTVMYNYNYRSNIDTPYVERNISQHNVLANLNVTIAGILPFTISYWTQQSNSLLFKDVSEYRVSFNAPAFQNHLKSSLRKKYLFLLNQAYDSSLAKLYHGKNLQKEDLKNRMAGMFQMQQLVAFNEIVRIPEITYKSYLPDSINKRIGDLLQNEAKGFLRLYDSTKKTYDRLSLEVDSLEKLYKKGVADIDQIKNSQSGDWQEYLTAKRKPGVSRENNLSSIDVPNKYKWLMGIRDFSVGRNLVNYSDLTAKNINVNGINFEYNSWYYLAITAGSINYRFREFSFANANRISQNFYMLRAGVGRKESNHLIMSIYKGQKQLYPSGTRQQVGSVNITGFSAEGRYQFNPYAYLTTEFGQTISPVNSTNTNSEESKSKVPVWSNKALALRFYSAIPKTNLRLEGFYKNSGVNFQSFSSIQTNVALQSWYVKADETLFKRKVRIATSLRSNEFSNPLLIQNYKSNTIFKSFTAALRIPHLPVFTVGYLPASQVTKLDDRLLENRFQTLNVNIFHIYKIDRIKAGSTLVYSKFYNTNADTGYIFYKATNVYFTQNFFFKAFTGNTSISRTTNPDYVLTVLDANVQFKLWNFPNTAVGFKINNLNNLNVKGGAYINATIPVFKTDFLFVSYEHGYLPGFNKSLIRNEMATIQFIKKFSFN